MIPRKTPVLFPIGIVCLVTGFCSFCVGSFVPPSPPDTILVPLDTIQTTSQTSQDFKSCSGVSEMIVVRKEYVSATLQTACWTPAIRTEDGKGGMRTEARNGESYVGYCGNGTQFSVKNLHQWNNTKVCPFPVYFKTTGKPFVLYITQE